MGAPSESYVDPSIAGNSGAGTIGDPWGDLQYGFDQVTRDASNGDRFNIKAGTDEILAAALTLATYGAPTVTVPIILQGYTSAAGDGGMGGIDCNSATMWASAAYDGIMMVNLHMHNGGAASIVTLDNDISVIGCEVNDTDNYGVFIDANSTVWGNYIHNCGVGGISRWYGITAYNWFEHGARNSTVAFTTRSSGNPSVICFNVIDVAGGSFGLACAELDYVYNNTIFSDGGTGRGIYFATANRGHQVVGNYVEGFSGVGGVGIFIGATTRSYVYGGNAVFDCTTEYDDSSEFTLKNIGGNLTLSSSALADPLNQDFRIVGSAIVGKGQPGNWKTFTHPQGIDIGAVQRRYATLGTPGRSGGRQG